MKYYLISTVKTTISRTSSISTWYLLMYVTCVCTWTNVTQIFRKASSSITDYLHYTLFLSIFWIVRITNFTKLSDFFHLYAPFLLKIYEKSAVIEVTKKYSSYQYSNNSIKDSHWISRDCSDIDRALARRLPELQISNNENCR